MQTDSCPGCRDTDVTRSIPTTLRTKPLSCTAQIQSFNFPPTVAAMATQHCSLSPGHLNAESQEKPGKHRPHCFLSFLFWICSASCTSCITGYYSKFDDVLKCKTQHIPSASLSAGVLAFSNLYNPQLPLPLCSFQLCSVGSRMSSRHPLALVPWKLPTHLQDLADRSPIPRNVVRTPQEPRWGMISKSYMSHDIEILKT